MKIIAGIFVTLLTLPAFAADPVTHWPALPFKVPEPKDNPATPAKVELGKMLLFRSALLRDGHSILFLLP
jgi:hypothetical protein